MKNDLKEQFKNNLLESSYEQDFDLAKLEWELKFIFKSHFKDYNCICNKPHIKNICVIRNKINNKTLIVGSDCINRFLDQINVEFYLNGRKNLKKNGIPNPIFVDFLLKNKILDDFGHKFYLSLYNKKKLTEKQVNYKQKLNQAVLFKLLKHENTLELYGRF